MERKTAVALRSGLRARMPDVRAALAAGTELDADTPVVAATGYGVIAEEIIALADASGVPVERDPALVAALAHLDVGQAIPPVLYQAVAELLVFLYDLDARQAEENCVSS